MNIYKSLRPEIFTRHWVECETGVRLAVRDDRNQWRLYSDNSELSDVVKVYKSETDTWHE
jgi:hypothetical protein